MPRPEPGKKSLPEITIMVPLYNEEENVLEVIERIYEVMEGLGRSFEVVLVDDGSSDHTPDLLLDAARTRPSLRAVLFRRNYGQTAALAAAIDYSRGEILIPMDGDLQNDPKDVPLLLAKLEEGYDVASGWRRDRKDPFLTRKLPSKLANGLISRISGVRLHDYGCTLKAYRREILQPVRLVGEMHRFIPILAAWEGARVAEVPVRHHPRTRGASKYGLGRTFKVILDLITVKFLVSFITKPIYVFGGVGALFFASSLLITGYTAWQKFFQGVWIHKNPWFLIAMSFGLAGLQFLLMGLLGELIIRVYFDASGRPPYSIRTVRQSEEDPPGGDAS